MRALLSAVFGAAALAATSGTAMATPTYVVSDPDLFANGSETVTIHDGGLSEGVEAGQFNVLATDTLTGIATALQVFCTDIFNDLSLPAEFTLGQLGDTVTDATKVSQINALLNNGNAAVNDAQSSAALQLALWALEYDTGDSGYAVTSGQFYVTGASADLVTAANQDLANIGNGTWQADPSATVLQLEAPDNQQLAYLGPPSPGTPSVPEPASVAVLAVGLLGLGMLRVMRLQSAQS
jgi:hypothetical protein